jgi:hypothetical protein
MYKLSTQAGARYLQAQRLQALGRDRNPSALLSLGPRDHIPPLAAATRGLQSVDLSLWERWGTHVRNSPSPQLVYPAHRLGLTGPVHICETLSLGKW